MLQPIKKMRSRYGGNHPRNKKNKNIWQNQYKIRRVISARLKNILKLWWIELLGASSEYRTPPSKVSFKGS